MAELKQQTDIQGTDEISNIMRSLELGQKVEKSLFTVISLSDQKLTQAQFKWQYPNERKVNVHNNFWWNLTNESLANWGPIKDFKKNHPDLYKEIKDGINDAQSKGKSGNEIGILLEDKLFQAYEIIFDHPEINTNHELFG